MNDPKSPIDRRGFIRDIAMGGVAAVTVTELVACGDNGETPTPTNTAIPADGITWDEETEVLILGGGGAGMAAAVEASRAGASVIILEKAENTGGTTALSGGVVQGSETTVQSDQGVSDTHQKHYDFWIQAGEGVPDPDLVRIMADKSKEAVEFLAELGQVFTSVYAVDPIPYIDDAVRLPRIHVSEGRGAGQAAVLRAEVDRLGLDVRVKATAKALVKDAEDGIVGVRVDIDGVETWIRARRAVIIATGGFDHNQEMAREYSPQQLWELETGVCLCAPTNTGDGIRLGMSAGADLAGLGGTVGYHSTQIGVNATPPLPGIWVNKYGMRFINEAGHYAYSVRAIYDQVEHLAWAIFDEHVREIDESLITAEGVQTGATLAALAGTLGVNATQLERTVAQWNLDTGAEPPSDPVFHKTVGLVPLDQPPYYAVKVTSLNLGSCGGLKIDTSTRVIDLDGQPIPRLYAVGMTAGGYIGPYYPGSGTALCGTVVFGRIAGANAAAETLLD